MVLMVLTLMSVTVPTRTNHSSLPLILIFV
jgi:hypothetical protein